MWVCRLSFSFLFSFAIFISKAQNLSSADLVSQYGLHKKSRIESDFVPYYAVVFPYFEEVLNDRKLIVRRRKQIIPFSSIPSAFNIFRPRNRGHYKIFISSGSIKALDPICFNALNDSARIGVLGHELSHLKDFGTKRSSYLLKVFFGHLSKKFVDAFEFETDHLAIQAGIGPYLLAWSKNVEQNLSPRYKDKSFGGKERYMRPETIIQYMKKYPDLYPHQN